jgi:2-polyprenyl-6-hydroxyphenyl methylase/3-demethylubiquinone-9 3-methyltransferase
MLEENIDKLCFTNREAKSISRESISFGFGANWKKYLSDLDESAIRQAEDSFVAFTRLPRMDNQTFLDIGCGSGLSSLVAYRLGAERVLSLDIDPNCIDCVTALRARFADGTDKWDVLQGSALDRDLLGSLGRFSYVYSWGVLHHTGSMWQALDNVIGCVEPRGRLQIALYNEHRNSARWLKIKRICNKWPRTVSPLLKMSYVSYVYAQSLARFQLPTKYVQQYRQNRGMSFRRDVDDWFDGLPYEYCKPDQVVNFLSDRGFVLLRLKVAGSIGCNEFLFRSENYSGGKA